MLERKYLFAEGNGPLVLEWLAALYTPDPEFQQGSVSSLYYDTPNFQLYHEKRGGDFLKAKIRLRWYSTLDEEDDDDDVTCFLELKTKDGAGRHKQRLPLSIPAGALRQPYRSEILRNLPARLLGSHPAASCLLCPLIVVSYRRHRFVAPTYEARISVDTGIRCASANAALFPNAEPFRLAAGVLETKSQGDELVGLIRPIKRYLRKSAFSKYAALLEALDQPLGVRL